MGNTSSARDGCDNDGTPLELEKEGIEVPPLLPIPAGLAKPGDKLCDVCENLDLTPQRFVVLPSDNEERNKPDEPNIRLGLVEEIKRKTHCPFCRLILTSLGPGLPTAVKDGERVLVTMAWGTNGSFPDPNQAARHIPKIRVLNPYPQTEGGDYISYEAGTNFFPEITILANDAPTPTKAFFTRIIGNQLDFNMVRNWLSMCQVWHGSICDESPVLNHQLNDPATEIPHFRLIDVVDNCIVRAPKRCRYVTLSYVWGPIDPSTILRTLKANVELLEQPGALALPDNLEKIPMTIRDAMQVVREINLRYLWVDSLCIIQDDTSQGGSKMSAISKMDLVYAGAYMTIMGATGDAKAGLPGVRKNTRGTSQGIEEINPELRLAFRPKYQDYLRDSAYFTRAWIYQEREFTKRSLMFVGGQAIFRCRKTEQWSEDMFVEDRLSKYGTVSSPDRNPDDIGQYEGWLQSYTGLLLTSNADIYLAFGGLARYFSTQLGVTLCHGVPDAFFDWFLLWHPTAGRPQMRRERTPSWSWSGWIGESVTDIAQCYSRSITGIRKAIRQRTWIIWYQREAHNSEKCIRVWLPKESSTPSGAAAQNFYGDSMQSRFSFDCDQTTPTSRTLVGAPNYYEDALNPTPGSGFLQFWTVSVNFRLGKSTSDDKSSGYTHVRSRVGIFGRDGRELSTIFVDSAWSKSNVPRDHEFILLCEGRDEKPKRGNLDDEKGWKYMMMLIEWHGDWAERVSVCSIKKRHLDRALGTGPIWKEIILG